MSHGRNASRFASDGAFAHTPRRFRAILGAAAGAAVAALIPAIKRAIFNRRWYYWPALGLLCEGAQAPFRCIRPATDALNAALNYMGALLQRDIGAAISHTHLHPGIGFLHRVSDQTEGLVYDFMDIFRAPLVEGAVVYLFNARRLRPDMFMALPDDGIRIASEGRRALIKHYEQALAKRVKAPNHETKLAWRPLMRRQVQDLALAFRQSQPDLFTPYLMEA